MLDMSLFKLTNREIPKPQCIRYTINREFPLHPSFSTQQQPHLVRPSSLKYCLYHCISTNIIDTPDMHVQTGETRYECADHICIYIHVNTCTYVRACARACFCVCVHTYIRMCTCMPMYLYTHKQTITHIVKEWGRQPTKHCVCSTRCFVLEIILSGSSDAFLPLFPGLCIEVHKFEDVCRARASARQTPQ